MAAQAQKTRTTFRMAVSIAEDVDAPPAQVWALLTDAAGFPGWNSTIERIDGDIADGQTIKLVATVDPSRTFKLKVSDVVAASRMTWSDGFAPVFQGVRTFRLTETAGGGTRFEMAETFSGLMLPIIAGSLPDFGPIFEDYVRDLKAAAEV